MLEPPLRRPSIADQVHPQTDGRVADAEEDIRKSDFADHLQDETNPQPDQIAVEQKEEPNLPSLEECLYGKATKKSPFIPENYDNDEIMEDYGESNNDAIDSDDKKDEKGGDQEVSINDDELNSHWFQDPNVCADYHDIDMAVLRKLCSKGIWTPEDEVDEINGSNPSPASNSSDPAHKQEICHRAIAWRVLLEQLPSRDIHATWPEKVPPQRTLYRELVEKYMENAIDPGHKLKGETHWQQSLRKNRSTSSDHSTTDEPEILECGDEENGKDDDGKEAGVKSIENEHQQPSLHEGKPNSEASLQLPLQVEKDQKSWNASTEFNNSANIKDIYDVFPRTTKYKKLWQKCGIVLTQGESAAAIGMNILRIPKELLSDDNEDSTSEDDNVVELVDIDTENWEDNTNKSRKDDLFFQFCKDAKLLSEIRRDVVRTNPHLRFYLDTEKNLGIRRHAAIERILFVWAKLNDHLYVQGMNEIVGTIYYVLAMDPTISGSSGGSKPERHSSWASHAEADTYFLFHSLMIRMDVRDVFVADLDHETSGLHARIANVEMLLQRHDPVVFHHLRESLGIDSSFYVIRWLTTLLSREFRLPDTIRLWDSLLASTHKENFLRYVCVSMVMAARDRLLCSDFGTCLKLLQNYPSGDIGMDELLEASRGLWIYETQISMACEKGGISLRKALRVVPPPEGITMAFGKVGPKPLRLTTVKPQAKPSPRKLIGAARRLFSWNGTSSQQNGADKEDVIDQIIDSTDSNVIFVNTSSLSNNSDDDKAISSENKESNSNTESTEVPVPLPPAMTPFRFWNRSRSEAKPTTSPLSTPDEAATPSVRSFWNHSNGETKPTTPTNPTTPDITTNTSNENDDDVDEYKNNDEDPLSTSVAVETNQNANVNADTNTNTNTNTNTGFWNRIRRRSSL